MHPGGSRLWRDRAQLYALWRRSFAPSSYRTKLLGRDDIEIKEPGRNGQQLRASWGRRGRRSQLSDDAQVCITLSNLPYGLPFGNLQRWFSLRSLSRLMCSPGAGRAHDHAGARHVGFQNCGGDHAAPGTDLLWTRYPLRSRRRAARSRTERCAGPLDLLNKRLSGVHINENQENPYQPDVNYRGYTALAADGNPEGISVYMDGVRQNSRLAISWLGLIPKIAISKSADAGLESVIRSQHPGRRGVDRDQDGHSAPGVSLSVNGGSFGRRAGEAEYGGLIPRD